MKRKKKRILPLLFPVLLLTSGAAALFLFRGEPVPPEETVPPIPQVEINDGASTVWMTPLPDVPVSTLSAADFTLDERGWPVYRGNDYTVLRGVDISELQGNIRWEQVADSGIDFVILRVGFRGYGEAGRLKEDISFSSNLQKAKEHGLLVGAYFFSQAVGVAEAEEEARLTLEILDGAALDLPVMFDWERVGAEDSRTRNIPTDAVQGYGEAFCRIVSDGGYEAGIYFSRQLGYYGYDLEKMKDHCWWVADPGTYPDFYYEAPFWQYSTDAEVPGFDIIVDMNLYFIPKDDAE